MSKDGQAIAEGGVAYESIDDVTTL